MTLAAAIAPSPEGTGAEPRDVRSLTAAARDALIVSSVQVDGQWRVLSHYGAQRWEFNDVPTNKGASYCRVDFSSVPAEFREAMKAMMYRYLRHGRAGQRRPRSSSLRNLAVYAMPFLRYLTGVGVKTFRDATPLLCKVYVDCTKAERRGPAGKPLSAGGLLMRFQAVEAIHELSQYTDDPMASPPWQSTSARVIAGQHGEADPRKQRDGRTPLIPDSVFTELFQVAWRLVERATELLDLRDGLRLIESEQLRLGASRNAVLKAKERHLNECGWGGGLGDFNDAVLDLRSACYVVVASLSGCRNHELAYVQTDSCYRTEDDEGAIYWWMRSRSSKTDAGETEWMVPEAAVTALKTMDRWARPYQAMVEREIDRRRAANAVDPEIAHARKHRRAVFLGKTAGRSNQVRTLSIGAWNNALKAFARKHGIDWELASHQFRRKFANYAARSQFGDLRYLKEHFKHWSMDMTLGYALNESQEMALFNEVYEEIDEIKMGVVGGWLREDEPLAGGYGGAIVAWRGGSDVTMFRDRRAMVRAIASSTAIRSNGHAWCTADDNLCVGNGGLEATRCTHCDNAVIGRVHARAYQGLYDHLKELLGCEDIGDGGRARVHRDLSRCREVLSSLGYDPEGTAA